jgi:hypothetical protein
MRGVPKPFYGNAGQRSTEIPFSNVQVQLRFGSKLKQPSACLAAQINCAPVTSLGFGQTPALEQEISMNPFQLWRGPRFGVLAQKSETGGYICQRISDLARPSTSLRQKPMVERQAQFCPGHLECVETLS